jgi:hypothetical protein
MDRNKGRNKFVSEINEHQIHIRMQIGDEGITKMCPSSEYTLLLLLDSGSFYKTAF